jgi:hypothetical protein
MLVLVLVPTLSAEILAGATEGITLRTGEKIPEPSPLIAFIRNWYDLPF